MAISNVTKARKSALKKLEDFSPLVGVSNVTLSRWENDPDNSFTLAKLKTYYDNVGQDGKQYIRDYVFSFFR